MKAWILPAGATSVDALTLTEQDRPTLGPHDVLVRVRACSLNYRDKLVAEGRYGSGPIKADLVPLSDGAGEVEAVGERVTRFRPGDRAAGLFFQDWHDGPPNPDSGPALGAPPAQGMLAEYVALPETGLVKLADSLTFAEAATLPCAGVTVWNALMEGRRPVGPGRTVLTLGTGGVSLLALKVAKAAGAQVIVTSSSDDKLERAQALGADEVINYRTTPDWGAEAARLAGGGVDHVVESVGAGTLAQSMVAVGYDGEIALIGAMSREGDTHPRPLLRKGASLRGVFVGSAAMARSLNRAIDANGVKPVIGATFGFEQAREALAHAASPDLFGKVVIAGA
jgi:NADPH:quinone reductase-like Zn-dependent oxidoreductase